MTQLAANRDAPRIDGDELKAALTITDEEVMYSGGMVARDYTDEIQMAADTQGLQIIGMSPTYRSNAEDGEVITPGGGSDGIMRGIFLLNNSSTSPVPRSSIGKPCFAEDDNTVAGNTTNYVSAGLVHDVTTDGVWVDMRPAALALAWAMRPKTYVAKTAAYTCTAAIAFEGRTVINMNGNAGGAVELTLPSAVAGMRVGVFRGSATAADDVSVQAGTGDKIRASDGLTAAAKQIDNTVDAISDILWLEAVDDTIWEAISPPKDWGSWVKNDT